MKVLMAFWVMRGSITNHCYSQYIIVVIIYRLSFLPENHWEKTATM